MEERSCQPAAPLPRGIHSGRSAKGGPQRAVDIDMDWESEAAELAQEEASLEVRHTFSCINVTCHTLFDIVLICLSAEILRLMTNQQLCVLLVLSLNCLCHGVICVVPCSCPKTNAPIKQQRCHLMQCCYMSLHITPPGLWF